MEGVTLVYPGRSSPTSQSLCVSSLRVLCDTVTVSNLFTFKLLRREDRNFYLPLHTRSLLCVGDLGPLPLLCLGGDPGSPPCVGTRGTQIWKTGSLDILLFRHNSVIQTPLKLSLLSLIVSPYHCIYHVRDLKERFWILNTYTFEHSTFETQSMTEHLNITVLELVLVSRGI